MSERTEVAIEPATLRSLISRPEVGGHATWRRTNIDTYRGVIELAVCDPGPRTAETFSCVAGDADDVAAVLGGAMRLLVTEPLARRLQLEPGSSLRLRTARGERPLPVAAVVRDYSSERGYALLSRTVYDALYDDPTIGSLELWAAQDVSADALVTALRAATADGQAVTVRSNRALREGSLDIFDRTFAITDVLRRICALVALLGVLGAFAALGLERRTESAVLRAVGASRFQVGGLVVGQSALLGAACGLLSLPLGALLGWLLVAVLNRRSFGWTLLETSLPVTVAVEAVALALGAAVLGAVLPAWRQSRAPIAAALREE
jgi:putative ABC transport system permease protein